MRNWAPWNYTPPCNHTQSFTVTPEGLHWLVPAPRRGRTGEMTGMRLTSQLRIIITLLVALGLPLCCCMFEKAPARDVGLAAARAGQSAPVANERPKCPLCARSKQPAADQETSGPPAPQPAPCSCQSQKQTPGLVEKKPDTGATATLVYILPDPAPYQPAVGRGFFIAAAPRPVLLPPRSLLHQHCALTV